MSASFFSRRSRSSLPTRPHAPLEALRAALTAESTSAALPRAMEAEGMGDSVAGLMTPRIDAGSSAGATHRPPM